MSIFASATRNTIELPFDAPHTVTIRRLSGGQVRKAQKAQMLESLEIVRAAGGFAAFDRKTQQEVGGEGQLEAQMAKAKKDPLTDHDVLTVLRFGVVAWSYDQPVNDGTLEDLDAEAQEFIARQILALTHPATAEAAEAERKND